MKKFSSQVGIDILGNKKLSQALPNSFFTQPSVIKIENKDEVKDVFYEAPAYDRKVNYYELYWSSFLENEKLLNEL